MKMKRFAQSLVAACALAAAAPLGAEVFTSTYSTTQCQDYNLITEMLIGPGVARHPNGAKIPQTSNVQIGVFSNLVAQALPSFTNGVILSTGKIDDGASLANTSAGHAWPDEALPGFGRDADLDRHFGESLSDPAGLVLYVQPRNKTLNIPFVMASEEFYNELVGTPAADLPTQETYEQYSDKFAFFLKEIADASDAGAFDADGNVIDDGSPMTVNIARLPDGGDVEIASVNQHTNTAFFISNVVADADGALVFPAQDIPLPMEFNGAIVGPVAVAEGLDTNKIYKLKIVIGDGYDNTVNSAVFLRDRGITSGADLKMAVEGPAHLAGTRTATFTDTVSNVGPATADGVKVTHFLPVGADPDSVVVESCDAGAVDPSSWGVVGGTNYFVWTVGDGFAPGSNAVLRIRCLLPEGEGVYTNAATVATSTGDYDESNNAAACTTVVGALPPLRIAAVATNKVYGAEMACDDLQFVLSVEGTGEALAATGIDVAFTNALGEAAQPTNAAAVVGAYGIVLSNVRGIDLSAYGGVTYVPGVLTVEPAPLTVRAKDATKMYGEALTPTAYEVEGLLNGDAVTAVDLASDGSPEEAPCGEYPIAVGDVRGTGLENYRISPERGTLTVAKRALEITARNMGKRYGEALDFVGDEFLLTRGTLVGEDAVEMVALASAGAPAAAPCREGGYPITPSDAQGAGLENYEIAYVDGTLDVEKAALTITAGDAAKTYGEEKELTAYTVDGLLNGDAVTAVALASDGAAATAPWRVDGYPIAASAAQGAGLANYEIVYEDGLLTVAKRALTVKANDAAKTYGEAVAFAGTEFTLASGALAAGDSIEAVALASDGAAATAPYREGGYPITASAARGAGLENYEIAYADGLLTVAKRALTVKANDAAKTYGEAVAFTGTEFTLAAGALAAGDTLEAVALASDGAAATAPWRAAGYPIAASGARGAGLENYEIAYEDGLLTVAKRALTVTARNMRKRYGEALDFVGDEFLLTRGTLAAGDALEAVTLASEGAPATAPYREGGYPITPSDAQGAGLENYAIAYEDGTLEIAKRALLITAHDAVKAYGEALTFEGTEFTVSGELQNGERVETVTLTSEKAAAADTEVGEYAAAIAPGFEVTGLDAGNYDIAFSNGTLTVTQAVLTVAVNDAKWRVGKARPSYSFADFSAQLRAGDTVADVTGGAGLATDVVYTNAVWGAAEPTEADEGVYAAEIWIDLASLDGARAANYAVTVEPGDLTVAAAEAELRTSVTAKLNWNTGLLDLTLTIRNEGDGEVDPDYDYWVELKGGPAASGATASVARTFYLDAPTGTMPGGFDYVDLTARVKAALRGVGNGDEVFDPGEAVTVTGVSVYHWKRWSPDRFLDADAFFVAGRLFCPADTDRNFSVSEAEKAAAAALLGTSSADYLEVSRLALLAFYRWDAATGTWK